MTLINSDLFEIMEACQSASLLPSMVSFEQGKIQATNVNPIKNDFSMIISIVSDLML